MDTKLKSKSIALTILLLFFFGFSSILYGLNNFTYYFHKDYYHTSEFQSNIDSYIAELHNYVFFPADVEATKNKVKVEAYEIEDHRSYYGTLAEQVESIKEQYKEKIAAANEIKDKKLVTLYEKERDEKIEDITKNFASDDYVEEKIRNEKYEEIEEAYKNYESEKNEFENKDTNFKYYLKDVQTGKVFTNIPNSSDFSTRSALFVKNYSVDKGTTLSENQNETNYYSSDSSGNFVTFASSTDTYNLELEGYISLPSSLTSTNTFVQLNKQYEIGQFIYFGLFIAGIIAFALSIIFTKKYGKKLTVNQPKVIEWYAKINFDFKLLIAIITSVIAYNKLSYLPYGIQNAIAYPENISTFIVNFIELLIVLFFLYIQYGACIPYMKNNEKLIADWKGSKIYQLAVSLKESFYNKKIGTRVVLSMMFVGFVGALSGVSLIAPFLLAFFIPACIFIIFPAFIIMLRKAKYFGMIVEATGKLVEGRMDQPIKVKGKGELREMAENLNALKDLVSTAEKVQVKSERLKTELITNVSHDLRTPLTSIITYTELLKSDSLTEDERKTYVEIVDRKSKRLKHLIDDLFEASKMASGNMELAKERVDIVQLMQQAIAEQGDLVNEKHLVFRLTNNDSPINVVVDGKRMWRVFDNILTNAVKYSLSGTRIYVSIVENNQNVVITCKNISAHELGGDINEMLERFKRGDSSRNTEGSGLGLAIAKSIVDLHEGAFELELDGDLFKVIITLNK